jgi:hypothetical protein
MFPLACATRAKVTHSSMGGGQTTSHQFASSATCLFIFAEG